MKKLVLLILTIYLGAGISCSQTSKSDEPVILITTDLGKIKLKLYNETPLHRDNFLKLAGEGFYDGVLFHRVINNFMIQGGDPGSKNAQSGVMLGNGGPDYTIPAEIVPGFIHKKGALAAARQGDQVNPLKASSGSQFYIVKGKLWRPGELDTLELRSNNTTRQNILRSVFTPVQQELEKYKLDKNETAFNLRIAELQAKADSLYNLAPKMKLSEEQRKAYTTIGGTPHLDGGYTVFGEVIEGLDVLDKISAVKTGQADRPVEDVKMSIKIL
jgi:cyclophilin family peptidyl-prolyl cis-trans isomerase